jgi:hypothetical protein
LKIDFGRVLEVGTITFAGIKLHEHTKPTADLGYYFLMYALLLTHLIYYFMVRKDRG